MRYHGVVLGVCDGGEASFQEGKRSSHIGKGGLSNMAQGHVTVDADERANIIKRCHWVEVYEQTGVSLVTFI
jgi:hypothetical protein